LVCEIATGKEIVSIKIATLTKEIHALTSKRRIDRHAEEYTVFIGQND
jgi:hypothetical protein